ncbi:hypothetical protein [Xylanibacillus composti]|uniref:Uncharacterized protein n=1 Tax=Xylanibacillus composti TaxID=1572762 RepID=A0A8J4H8T3_9BACL|nr:hypothetical protein [Xylanibacillus composti]GIQ71138.1 hypothetical protein XYCOK13_39620 [Xylanibacillus composti]
MPDEQKNLENATDQHFFEEIAEVADFIHDRLGDVEDPTGLNNTVEEYAEHENQEE